MKKVAFTDISLIEIYVNNDACKDRNSDTYKHMHMHTHTHTHTSWIFSNFKLKNQYNLTTLKTIYLILKHYLF